MFINLLMGICAVLLAIPVIVLCIQVLSALFFKTKLIESSHPDASVAVLIPAHNESNGIIETLLSIIPQLNSNDILLVVADNCTDNTAEIAKQNGAMVIERQDSLRRGKGYALDFGIQYLSKTPRDALIIIDADCILAPQSLKKLAFHTLHHHRPVQALYLMQHKAQAGLKAKIAEFAWCVKNWVRPLGFLNLGLPCQLMGTGMAFPWQSLHQVDLANGNIVEDMKLGIDFALAGQAPLFYPEAKVMSFFPLTTDVQKGQSKRWEHGHMAMILSEAPRLMRQAFNLRNFTMLAMALDLSVPPLALLVGLLFGLSFVNGLLFYYFELAAYAFAINLLCLLMLTTAVLCAWFGWGRKIISLSSMLFVPIYILLKIPNHLSFIFKRQSTWNKTKREQK